jgi:BirA family biotin operon repressor/biotin-[acetyl-CoA-carboxylase] ligase
MAIGSIIYYKKQCYNSMDWAKKELAHAPDGAVFLADHHQAPRGRQGRSWQYEKGHLAVTIALKPSVEHILSVNRDERLIQFVMAFSVGFLQPLRMYNIGLKWPNDFVWKSKKVGGMLIETVWNADDLLGVVVGIGLNVNNQFLSGNELYSKAISLRSIADRLIDKDNLLRTLCIHADDWYEIWKNGESDKIFTAWKNAQVYLGKSIRVHVQGGKELQGIFQDVTPTGMIILKQENGTIHQIDFFETDVL